MLLRWPAAKRCDCLLIARMNTQNAATWCDAPVAVQTSVHQKTEMWLQAHQGCVIMHCQVTALIGNADALSAPILRYHHRFDFCVTLRRLRQWVASIPLGDQACHDSRLPPRCKRDIQLLRWNCLSLEDGADICCETSVTTCLHCVNSQKSEDLKLCRN
jgi:hypothetical protein